MAAVLLISPCHRPRRLRIGSPRAMLLAHRGVIMYFCSPPLPVRQQAA